MNAIALAITAAVTPKIYFVDRSIVSWLLITVMLVGMIIGSAIATSVIALVQPEDEVWRFASHLAYLGFVVPMIVAIVIVLRLLWRWMRSETPLRD